MAMSPLGGRPAPKEMLVDLAKLEGQYYARMPDMETKQIGNNALDGAGRRNR